MNVRNRAEMLARPGLRARRAQRRERMTFFTETRAHKWIAARALLTGWTLWILSLMWFFPFVSRYFFVYTTPKPFEVTSPYASPNYFVRNVDVSFSLSEPISSTASLIWMPIAAPIGIDQRRLADVRNFTFGILLPF